MILNKIKSFFIPLFLLAFSLFGCGVKVQYSFSGAATNAKNISITEFYNNADLGPANMGQSFTNELKNYFLQNSSLSIVQENGELQFEGEITDFKINPLAPTVNPNQNQLSSASSTRLTISVKVTFVNTLDEKMSFKNRNFSFYKDFPNELTLSDVEEQFTKEIFERIITDIFNASIANW